MKLFCLATYLLLASFGFSQKSFYFSSPVPSEGAKVSHIDAKWYGKYSSDDGLRTYEVNEKGIFIVSTSISSISKETVRESSKYKVRNGFLYGVVKNDSVPYVLDEGRYYFGVRNKDVFVGDGSSNILTKDSRNGGYVLNQYENGHYIPSQITFKGNKMTIRYFEYDVDSTEFDFIASQKSIPTSFQELVILSPNIDEYNTLVSKNIYALPSVLNKVK